MKIALLLLLVAAVLGGLVGTLMVRDPGYVLIAFADHVLETSLWFALAMLALAYLVIRAVVIVVVHLFRGKGYFGVWRAHWFERGARRQTVRGLLLFAEGQWEEARRLLEGAAQRVAIPFVNYLHAARAAHWLGDHEGRDELLSRAEKAAAGSSTAVLLTRAQLQLAEQRWVDGRTTLMQLYEQSPRHPLMLDLLRRCHEQLGDWPALLELLPQLRKAGAVDTETIEALERRTWAHQLETADSAESWRRLPKPLKRDPELVAARARRLLASGEPAAAEGLVRKALERGWNGRLVELYGQIPSPRLARQLAAGESWLTDHPNDAALLLTLGRIAMMDGAWAKAREYLEASLRLKASAAVYGELGRLLNHLGEFIRGSEYLSKAGAELPALPLPPRPAR